MTKPGEFDQAIVRYTTDSGLTFTISQKRTIAAAVNNPTVLLRASQGTPERWSLRFIYIATVYGGKLYRRKIIIATAGNPLFQGVQSVVIIDGVRWKVVERRGEYSRGGFANP